MEVTPPPPPFKKFNTLEEVLWYITGEQWYPKKHRQTVEFINRRLKPI